MNNKYVSAARSVLQILSAGFASLCFFSQAHGLQQHQQIQGPFATPREVTAKCLECHPQQAVEVMNSSHWTWTRKAVINGESLQFGKTDSLAGFAIDVASNPARCMACHISHDRGGSLEAPSPAAVDCLVCHDTTGRYLLSAPSSARGENPSDLAVMARDVGRPTPVNCGACHFTDCGLAPSGAQNRLAGAADIHLSAAGGNFSCQSCHAGSGGHIFSRHLNRPGEASLSGRGCASCHSDTPHGMDLLNRHGERIACRTCHIPAAGRGAPVLIGWNWILSGKTVPVHQNRPGSRLQIHDLNGLRGAADIDPIYLWDDGSDTVYTRGQRIRPEELTVLQGPAEKNERSKIVPFRIIYGTQLYDRKYRYLISPLLEPEGPVLFSAAGPESLAEEGMKAVVLPYSGQYGYTATAVYKRISHGVAPAGQALDCLDCHGLSGRMNWPALGYDADPWSNDLAGQPAAEESGSVTDPGPTLPAADEWDIPAGSD